MKTTLYNLNKQDRFFFFFFLYHTLFQIPNWLLRQQRVAINYRCNEIIFTNYTRDIVFNIYISSANIIVRTGETTLLL